MPFDPVLDAVETSHQAEIDAATKDTQDLSNEATEIGVKAEADPSELESEETGHLGDVDAEADLDLDLDPDLELDPDASSKETSQEMTEFREPREPSDEPTPDDEPTFSVIRTNSRISTSASKPIILRHKFSENKLLPAKKKHRVIAGPMKLTNSLASARSRHLKKNDGEPFWRKDIQYELLQTLFNDQTRVFTDTVDGGKTTFRDLYIKTIANSPKCSKVLKERLLHDMKMSIPTCMICLLVNVGRMNTTINFVPDMKSQLRTYHSIPALQVNYSETENKHDKQLQDTPRLKSILKACCDDEETTLLASKLPKTNIINLIFILCNIEDAVNNRFFKNTRYKYIDLFMNNSLNPHERAKLFLWLVYNYQETNLTDSEIMMNPFGATMPELTTVDESQYDIDTEEELEFGKTLLDQRVKFLNESPDPVASSPLKADHSPTTHITPITPSTALVDTTAPPFTTSSVPPSSQSASQGTGQTESDVVSANTPATAQPTLRQDIDVPHVLSLISSLRAQNKRKRDYMGAIKHEHGWILRESGGPEDLTRLRVKNYKGDWAEYSSTMQLVFSELKDQFAAAVQAEKPVKESDAEIEYEEGNLNLKAFTF